MNDKCPKCGVKWYSDETIYEFFLKNNTAEEARRIAEMYGDTVDNPKHFGKNVIGIEIPEKYDGISHYKCEECNTYFDRWTMKEVNENEII